MFCVYPSSSKGRVSELLEPYLEQAKVIVGSKYTSDQLLEQVVSAPDTSRIRARAKGGVPSEDISIAAQARTVRVNPKYRGKLAGRTVIIFDDFTTEGKSLEWARIAPNDLEPTPRHRLP